ncbi:transcription elongation factor SPT4 [Echinops telfairi]|uniref:Transcription elongation factor SPT4 n=1 Tax=Echinops telfairi TaxID=9371 RepID=A0AC55DU13_ECHTE|nr:transcription elongation factor SPT4 [Echinops telfairi]
MEATTHWNYLYPKAPVQINGKGNAREHSAHLSSTIDQFEYDGCDNCDTYLQMKGNREMVYDCTSSSFDGIIAMMSPEDSWVSKWQRVSNFKPGVYAVSVTGRLPQGNNHNSCCLFTVPSKHYRSPWCASVPICMCYKALRFMEREVKAQKNPKPNTFKSILPQRNSECPCLGV